MRIELANYVITRDAYQYIISEKVTSEKKDTGELYETTRSLNRYPKKVNDLLDMLFEIELTKSEAATIDELRTDVKKAFALIKSWSKEFKGEI